MSANKNRSYLLDINARMYLRMQKRVILGSLMVLPLAFALGLFFIAGHGAQGVDSLPAESAPPSLLLMVPVAGGVLLLLLLTFGVRFAIGRFRQKKAAAAQLIALQQTDAGALIESLEKSMLPGQSLPDWDAYTAHSLALAHLLYGDESGAKVRMNAVRWEQKPPMIQALAASIDAWRCILGGDVSGGMQWAKKAQSLATTGAWPGAGALHDFHQTAIDVAQALTGSATRSTIAALDRRLRNWRYPMIQAVSAFGLMHAFRNRGDTGMAEAVRTDLVRLAPHCQPLHRESPQAADLVCDASLSVGAVALDGQAPGTTGAVRKVLLFWGLSWAGLLLLFAVLYVVSRG